MSGMMNQLNPQNHLTNQFPSQYFAATAEIVWFVNLLLSTYYALRNQSICDYLNYIWKQNWLLNQMCKLPEQALKSHSFYSLKNHIRLNCNSCMFCMSLGLDDKISWLIIPHKKLVNHFLLAMDMTKHMFINHFSPSRCYATLPPGARNCRKKKCGLSNQVGVSSFHPYPICHIRYQ